MAHSFVINYNDSAAFTFDATLVEVSGGTLRLKDLGGGTYSTADPAVTTQHQFMASAITAFAISYSAPASEVKFQLIIDGTPYWYNSVAATWEEADSTLYAEANTATELNANLATLVAQLNLTASFAAKLRIFLHSNAGSTRPVLTSSTFTFTHAEATPATISECLIFAYLSDLLGASYVHDSSKPVTLIVQNERPFFHGNKLIRPFTKTATFNSSGYAELSVIETETPAEKLEIMLTYYEGPSLKVLRFKPTEIPNTATRALNLIVSLFETDF